MKAVIHFDGGCEPNPGTKYGSYSVVMDEVFEISSKRFDLGYGTNNEAEFESLIAALDGLIEATLKAQVPFRDISVSIFTDSTIVRNWLQKFHSFKPEKVKNERRIAMSKLAGRCVQLLSAFKAFEISWNSRDVNVEKFGH